MLLQIGFLHVKNIHVAINKRVTSLFKYQLTQICERILRESEQESSEKNSPMNKTEIVLS